MVGSPQLWSNLADKGLDSGWVGRDVVIHVTSTLAAIDWEAKEIQRRLCIKRKWNYRLKEIFSERNGFFDGKLARKVNFINKLRFSSFFLDMNFKSKLCEGPETTTQW